MATREFDVNRALSSQTLPFVPSSFITGGGGDRRSQNPTTFQVPGRLAGGAGEARTASGGDKGQGGANLQSLLGQPQDPFNLPQFAGPFSAPLLPQQLDAIQGFSNLFQSAQGAFGDPTQLQNALNQALSGDPALGGGTTAQQLAQRFDIGSQGQAATQSLLGGLSGQMMPIQQGLGQLAGGIQGQLAPSTQGMQNIIGQIPGLAQADLGQVNQALQGILGGTGTTARTQELLGGVNPAFQQALGAERFDLTPTFQAQEQLFQDALSRQLGDVRSEFSALGLGPGASARSAELARAGGTAQAQFQLGQQELSRQAFEDAEQRRLSALGLAPGLAQASEIGTQQQISALPAALQAALAPAQLGLQGAQTQLGGLQALGQLGLAGTGLGADILGQQGQLGLAGAGLQGQLAQQLFGQEQLPFQTGLAQQNSEAQRRLQALPAAFEAFGLPAQLGSQLFGLGEGARQAADVDVARRMQEFARTQGGGLNQLLAILQGTPQQQTAFGPAPLAQTAGLAGGLAPLVGQIMENK